MNPLLAAVVPAVGVTVGLATLEDVKIMLMNLKIRGNLEEFSKPNLLSRIHKISVLCDLKCYHREQLVPGITKISFQVTFNAGGHVLFGISTLGFLSCVAENSEKHDITFDNVSGMSIGPNINEIQSFYNNQYNFSINNLDFSLAEKYAKIKYHLDDRRLGTNYGFRSDFRYKYECLKKINEIIHLVSNKDFETALYYIRKDDYVIAISFICKNSKKKFITSVENCCKFMITHVDINESHFFDLLNELYDNYTQNIDETINKANYYLQTFPFESYYYKNYLNEITKNLILSQNGIEHLKNGNFIRAKSQFDQIKGCFNEYKEYSNFCGIAIAIINNLRNDIAINESHIQELNIYNYLKGDARFKFKNLHKVCTILSKATLNREDTFEYYFTNVKIFKEAIKNSRFECIDIILSEKLNEIHLKVPEILEIHKEKAEQNIKNNNFDEAVNDYEKCYKLADEHDLKNKNEYTNLFKKSQHYIKAKELWEKSLNSESNGEIDIARTQLIDARKEINSFEKYFNVNVKTNLSDKIENKITANILINEGLSLLNQSEFTKSYKSINVGYNFLKNCNEESLHNSSYLIEQVLNNLQAKIDDDQSNKFRKEEEVFINIPYPVEETENMYLELEKTIQLCGPNIFCKT
ncbi:uncharacterized protein LOC123304966 [Chrysoperla carnea]|uniref:uncharacterized protein LOC123304966 n=1 Tax=Chrysoperla carnea TaxID=189513 RepID=UPI001D071D58|nr:uncharacterized protein LOC123304966 [Chrysoperla carnea]